MQGIVFDTSALYMWIRGREEEITPMLPHLRDRRPVISWMQMAEIATVIARDGNDVESSIERIRAAVQVIAPTEADFISGAALRMEARRAGAKKFSLCDGVIHAFARRNGMPLLTFDADFAFLTNDGRWAAPATTAEVILLERLAA